MTQASKGNVVRLAEQSKLAFGTRHKNVIMGRRDSLTRLYVVTSGRISDKAKEFIIDASSNPNIAFMDGQELLNLIERHMPEYFAYQDKLIRGYFLSVKPEVTRVQVFAPGQVQEKSVDDIFVPPLLSEGEEKHEALRSQSRRVKTEDLLGMSGPVLVLGEQHAGKTALLKHLFSALLGRYSDQETTGRIPVMLTFAEIESSGFDFTETISQQFLKHDAGEIAGNVQEYLMNGRMVFLLDGYTQLMSTDSRKQALAALESFVARFPRTLVIWTSRVLGSIPEQHQTNSRVFKILPLRPSQLFKLIEKLIPRTGVAQDSIVRSIEANLALSHLPRTPLLCSLILSICTEQEGFIASNLADIFQKYLELLLGKWSAGTAYGRGFSYPVREEFLERLALKMLEDGLPSISMPEARITGDEFFASMGMDLDGGQLVADLLDSGVLRAESDRLEFAVPSFQEYFAAKRLVDEGNGDDWVAERIPDRAFSDTILIYAGLRRDCTDLILRVLASPPDGYGALDRSTLSLDATGQPLLDDGSAVPEAEDGTDSAGVTDLTGAGEQHDVMEDLDTAWEFVADLNEELRSQSEKLLSAEKTARQRLLTDVGHWATMVGIIAKNGVFTQQTAKEAAVKKVIETFSKLTAVLMDEIDASLEKDVREPAKLMALMVLNGMTLAYFGSPALRQAYLACLDRLTGETERYLLALVMLNLGLPGYIRVVEEHANRSRNLLEIYVLYVSIDGILKLRNLSHEDRGAMEDVQPRLGRRLRSAREYFAQAFRTVLDRRRALTSGC